VYIVGTQQAIQAYALTMQIALLLPIMWIEVLRSKIHRLTIALDDGSYIGSGALELLTTVFSNLIPGADIPNISRVHTGACGDCFNRSITHIGNVNIVDTYVWIYQEGRRTFHPNSFTDTKTNRLTP